jgi:DNA-binding NarL/FixJ family response regulator
MTITDNHITIVQLYADGLCTKQIAHVLARPKGSIHNEIHDLKKAHNCRNIACLVLLFYIKGLVIYRELKKAS